MLGAIIGDIAGSIYEFDNIKTTEFDFMGVGTHFTDDTVMSCAVAKGAIEGYGDIDETRAQIVKAMQELGRLYPRAGYGGNFSKWIYEENPEPYNSWGNGSAMRVASIGWLYDTLENVELFAKASAEVTHNHPEGIKGAQSVAAAIFLARTGSNKQDIRDYVEATYCYDLSKTCDDIRPAYRFNESCQNTVPQAFAAFFEGKSVEEVVRLAISLGGDSDTLAAIAGSMAEAAYGIPDDLATTALDKLDDRLRIEAIAFSDFVDNRQANDAIRQWTMGLGDMNRILRGEPRVDQDKQVALKSSWKTCRMPKARTVIPVDIKLTEEDLRILVLGHVPDVMEDHWFMYFDGSNIRYYRSWTGFFIYKAKVERDYCSNEHGLRVTKLTVNRDPKQYSETNDEKDIALFQMLIAEETGRDSSVYWKRIQELSQHDNH